MPAGFSQKIHAFARPSSVWRATWATVPPVTATDGVSASNAASGLPNATITCGRSPAPLCRADANRLGGNAAQSPTPVTGGFETVSSRTGANLLPSTW